MARCSMVGAAIVLAACFDDTGIPLEPESSLDAGSLAGARHEACNTATRAPLPAPPEIVVDATGRPAFDWFRDYLCDEEPVRGYVHCGSYLGYPEDGCDACFGESGLCTAASLTPPACGSVHYARGARQHCVDCVPPAAKARACCDGDPFVDCRAWPFRGTSAPGELCATHEDCEPGLLCTGVCTCPEGGPKTTSCLDARTAL